MSNWLQKLKRQYKMDETKESTPDVSYTTISSDPSLIVTSNPIGTNWPYNMTSASMSAMTATAIASPTITGAININANTYTIGNTYQPQYIIQFNNNGKEIVRLTKDGVVEWMNGIEIDEAAEAFTKTLTLGAEMSAGITKKVKLDIRDSVFNDIIAIAKEKGSLTAEDLTFLLQASKIVEKLKGGKNDT